MNQLLKRIIASVAVILIGVSASAQITTSQLGGLVTDSQGEPIIGAAVVATHVPSGTVYGAATNTNGRYIITGMRAGGPYTVEFSSLGYQTVTVTDVTISLAENFSINQTLKDDKEMLEAAMVVSSANSKFSQEKTGAVTNITKNQITSLPTVSRSITEITKLSPFGGNGMSFAGSDGRNSNFTVDGADFNQNFGLSSALPGGGSPISIDAIEELQVVVSPYDVRQANFVGGGVNAITKSGTNTLRGTAYVYHRNENMRGNSICGEELGARDIDRNTTYGFTLGGPIIKNKLFFFVNFEYSQVPTVVNRWKPSEDGVADPDNYLSRTTVKDMQDMKDYLMTKYKYDTGSYTDFPADEHTMKYLARLDWNINKNNHLAVRFNRTSNVTWTPTNGSSSDVGQKATQNRISKYSMAFANSFYGTNKDVKTISVDFNSRLTDQLSNQFLATYSLIDDVRIPMSDEFPMVDILDGTGSFTPYMTFGYELFTYKNAVSNRSLTIKDDLTYFAGNHKITAGYTYGYMMALNRYMRNGTGYYRYNSLEDFYAGAAPESVCITYGYNGEQNPAAKIRYHKTDAYIQDEFNATDNLKLTAGVRLECITFDNRDVMTNQAVYDVDYNGRHIDTGTWPTPKLQVSPRIGFTWDVFGDRSLKVRGGTGLFAGRVPLVFFTNMPTNSDMFQKKAILTTIYDKGAVNEKKSDVKELAQFAGDLITNRNELIKKFQEVDPSRFPNTISPSKGVLGKDIQAVDPKFKMPMDWKSSIAADYNVPVSFPFTLTGEFIFRKAVNATYLTDYNLKDVEGFTRLNGADNRHIFPSDYTYTNTSAYVLQNTHKGYGYIATFGFKMDPMSNLHINAAYTHTVSKELTGMPGSNASSAFTYVPSTEGPNNLPLHNSQYVTPDRAFVSLTYDDKANNHYSLFYEAIRGSYYYSYMYANDLNNDNYNYDAIYIPKDDSEIRFKTQDDADRYWAFAKNNPYLTKHAGSYAEAYSVYSPFVHKLDFHFAHDFKVNIGKTTNVLQLNCDIRNILNLFNSSWGVVKYMNPDLNEGRILKVEEIAADGVPVFTAIPAVGGDTQMWKPYHTVGQCWSAQIGIKYIFN